MNRFGRNARVTLAADYLARLQTGGHVARRDLDVAEAAAARCGGSMSTHSREPPVRWGAPATFLARLSDSPAAMMRSCLLAVRHVGGTLRGEPCRMPS